MKRRAASNKFKRQLYISAIIAIVYMVWKERNNAFWNHQVHTVDKIVKEIKSIIILELNEDSSENSRSR